MPILPRLARDATGATAVEFAFAGVVAVLMLMVVIESGRAIWTRNTLTSVAEEVARCAAVEWGAADPPTRSCRDADLARSHAVLKATQRGMAVSSGDVTVTKPAASADCGAVGSFVLVRIDHTFKPILGIQGFTTIPIRGQACYPG